MALLPSNMANEGKQADAEIRRRQQIKRWEDSETSREPTSPKAASRRVNFQDGCVFLAACSSGDQEEVKRLLERGADINTSNVDGLTALHQACIDDNLEMVEFLVDKQADVDACDNEGWTPLHAIASCGYTEIARYLLKHGADVAAVNNDGDLAIDIADDEEMENLLREEMEKKDVDAESARREEEDMMMADANRWLLNDKVEDKVHPKTGATALHVAAAKGYVNVMNVLLQAGVDINAPDADGWTPLHAAVHWGQEDACQILVDHLCDMEVKNQAGHTVFDLADSDMMTFLEELRKKQVTLRRAEDSKNDIIHAHGHGSRRRTSVTRMSSDQKQNVITKTVEEERATLDAKLSHLSLLKDEEQDSKTAANSPSIRNAETERRNERNRQSSLISQPQYPRKRPSSLSSLDSLRLDMPRIEEGLEMDRLDSAATTITLSPLPSPFSPPWLAAMEMEVTPQVGSSDMVDSAVPVIKIRDVSNSYQSYTSPTGSEELVQSWRRSLRKTGSSHTVHDQMSENEDTSLPRSASSPRITFDRTESVPDRLSGHRLLSSTSSSLTTSSITSSTLSTPTDSRIADRYSWSGGQSSYAPYRDYLSRSGYKPFYQRQQEVNQQKEQERASTLSSGRATRPNSSIPALSSIFSTPSPLSSTTTASTTTTSTTTTTVVTNSAISVFRRTYEPPKRDEETETQRKARAKHARQTRRSTQGVSLEDLEMAEKVVSKGDGSHNSTTDSTSSSSKTSIPGSSQDVTSITTTAVTTTATTTTMPSSSSLSSTWTSNRERTSSTMTNDTERTNSSSFTSTSDRERTNSSSLTETGDKERTNNFSYRDSMRRWNWDNRQDEDSTIRTSFRRLREDKDSATNGVSSSLDITSSYVPRSQRNALSTSDLGSSSPSLSRASSLRSRLRAEETESSADGNRRREETKESKRTDSGSSEPVVEKKESATSRARRKRNERRPTGKVDYIPEDLDKDKENQPGDEQTEGSSEHSSRLGRYSSSDVPTDSSSRNRPGSYTEYSRSTNNLDEYKKMYEDEKEENGKLKKELDQCKKELLEAKVELDKLMKHNDPSRSSDSTDKRERRTLERKVSEYEEELKQLEKIKAENKKLKEENRALTRVVSKLSK